MKKITLLAVTLLMGITAMADGTIYFKNTLGWENVYVYFYTGGYWDNEKGAGSQSGGSFASGPHGMTLVSGETDIYSFDYTGNYSVVAFTKDCQENYGNFYQTQAVYRGDFKQSKPLFVPNTTSNETKNQTQYFNNGEWEAYGVPVAIVDFALSSQLLLNEAVALTATSENVTNPVYVYSVKSSDGVYAALESNTWTPTATGSYTVKVEVKEGAEGDVVAFKEVATTVVNPIVANTKLYLQPNAKWLEVAARYAAYFYVGTTNMWVDMTQVEGTDMYEVTVPAEGPWTTVIFCRMNPGQTENKWDNKWTQTNDLNYNGTDNLYMIDANATTDGNVKSNGIWSLYEDEQGPSTIVEVTENAPLFSINGRTLNVALDEEAEISIYTISGQMIEHIVASDYAREMQQGVYVIRIGNTTQKAVVY